MRNLSFHFFKAMKDFLAIVLLILLAIWIDNHFGPHSPTDLQCHPFPPCATSSR